MRRCSFPGGADNNEQYWKLLLDGANVIREVPDERWNTKHYHSTDRTKPGKSYSVHAGLLKDE